MPFDFAYHAFKKKNGFAIKKISGKISASVNRGTACSYLSTENIKLSAGF